MKPDQQIKLVYIAGYGRSGTTLLDIALGQHESVFGAGEITALSRHVWDKDEYCACGASVRQCPLWSEVVQRWLAGEDPDFLENYHRLQRSVESILSPRRALWRLSHKAETSEYARGTSKLLKSLAAVAGRSVLVDSSKLPGRAFALAEAPGIELYVVHVVRDGRGVGWSMMKPFKRQVEKGLQKELKPKPLLYTALRWVVVNLAAELLCRKVGKHRCIRVRYEDFVSNPAATLGSILSLVGGDIQPEQYREDSPFRPEHQVAGSRHRMEKEITLLKDERWQNEMPAQKRRTFGIPGGVLLRRYGYPTRVEQA